MLHILGFVFAGSRPLGHIWPGSCFCLSGIKVLCLEHIPTNALCLFSEGTQKGSAKTPPTSQVPWRKIDAEYAVWDRKSHHTCCPGGT